MSQASCEWNSRGDSFKASSSSDEIICGTCLDTTCQQLTHFFLLLCNELRNIPREVLSSESACSLPKEVNQSKAQIFFTSCTCQHIFYLPFVDFLSQFFCTWVGAEETDQLEVSKPSDWDSSSLDFSSLLYGKEELAQVTEALQVVITMISESINRL